MSKSKIIDRIRKLLALARDKGASEAEASLAMAKASELMLQHNIDNIDEDTGVGVIAGIPVGGDLGQNWHIIIAAAVGRLYTCRGVRYGRDKFYFVGKPDNVEACEVTLVFIVGQVDALYKEALNIYSGRLNKTMRAELRTTFKEACAIRIAHRVNEIVATMRNRIPDHKALVVIDQSLSEADDLLNAGGVKKGKEVTVRKSGIGTGAGWSAGDAIKLQTEL